MQPNNGNYPSTDKSNEIIIPSRSIVMQSQETTQESTQSITDIKSLRIASNFGATLGVKKLLTTVQVGKPKKPQFFRTHQSEDMVFPAMILENKEAQETYVVYPEVAQAISELVRPAILHAAIDRQNTVFLIPVPLPGDSGVRHPTHESLAQAVEYAKLKWIRITYNKHNSGYDIYEAEALLPEPDWPSGDIDTFVQTAFRGKIITSLDHPVIQAHLGRA
jgi:hypothetical protein